MLTRCEDQLAREEVMTMCNIPRLSGKWLRDVYILPFFVMYRVWVLLWQEEFFGEIFVQPCRAEEQELRSALGGVHDVLP